MVKKIREDANGGVSQKMLPFETVNKLVYVTPYKNVLACRGEIWFDKDFTWMA